MTLCNNYFKIRKTFSLFVTLNNKLFQKDPKNVSEVFLSHFEVKPVITKNLDSTEVFGQIWSQF